MNRSIILLVFIASFVGVYSQQEGFNQLRKDQMSSFMPSESRIFMNLSGNWQRSFDNAEWTNAYIPNSTSREEQVYYQKTIKINKNLSEKMTWHLYFMGVQDQVQIYVNEQYVGSYFGGLNPFAVKIPRGMIQGETNNIKFIVSPVDYSSEKLIKQNLFSRKIFTGMIREVFLIGTPQIWIKSIDFNYVFNDALTVAKADVEVKISASDLELFTSPYSDSLIISPSTSKAKIRVEINLINKTTGQVVLSPESKVIEIERERTIDTKFSFSINNPMLWGIDNPNAYYLQTKITKDGNLIDDYREIVGFKSIRTIENKGKLILTLNNKPFKIKGVTYIEDYEGLGQTLSSKQMQKDIENIKTLGANTVRFKYSSPHPYFAHLCDLNGILLLIELPIYDAPSDLLNTDEIKVRMKNLTKLMVPAYDNRPSLMAWGISEGLDESDENNLKFSNLLIDQFRSLSGSLIYKIVNFGADTINSLGYDLIGITHKLNDPDFTYIKNEMTRLQDLSPEIPLFYTYGTSLQLGNHTGYTDQQSLEYQAYYIRNSYLLANERQYVGNIINTYNDYLLNNPSIINNNDELYLGTFGLVNRARQPRISYTMLQTLFNKEKEPLLDAGSYSEESPVSYIIVGLALGIVLIFLINRFRRFREYLFRSVLRPYNFYADIRDQRIMSNIQTIILGLVIAVSCGIFFASIIYFYRSNELAQYIYMILIPANWMQEMTFKFAWQPEILMIALSLFNVLFILFLSFVLRIVSFFMRARILYIDTLTISIWAGVPFLFLLPISIVLIRGLVLMPAITPFIWILLIIVFVWVALRFFKSTAVVFDKPEFKVYIIGAMVLAILLGLPLAYYQYEYSIFSYTDYFFTVLINS